MRSLFWFMMSFVFIFLCLLLLLVHWPIKKLDWIVNALGDFMMDMADACERRVR